MGEKKKKKMGKKWATQKNAHFFKNQKMAVLKRKKWSQKWAL